MNHVYLIVTVLCLVYVLLDLTLGFVSDRLDNWTEDAKEMRECYNKYGFIVFITMITYALAWA